MKKIEIDPAKPELYPDIFVLGHCNVCKFCYVNKRANRCTYGGPFDDDLHYKPSHFKIGERSECL